MQGQEANPAYREYSLRPGIVDFYHLELVALKRVAKSSWMPHFRLLAPSRPPLYISPAAPIRIRKHIEFLQRGPKASRGDTREGPKAHKQRCIPGPTHPEVVTTKPNERSPIPGLPHPVEEGTVEVPQSSKMTFGFRRGFIIRIRRAVKKTRKGK